MAIAMKVGERLKAGYDGGHVACRVTGTAIEVEMSLEPSCVYTVRAIAAGTATVHVKQAGSDETEAAVEFTVTEASNEQTD